MSDVPSLSYEEAEAMMAEFGYAKHSDCRDLVLAAFGEGAIRARAAIEAAVREQPKSQQGDSAVASEGGSCVSVLAEQREANKTSLCVLCALLDAHEWHPNMRKDIEFAIAANRAAIERAALSTAGAQRRASEQDETTSAEEQR